MSQLPKFVAGAMPADIAEGLDPGCYLAQLRSTSDRTSRGVLYATAEEPPADRESWFECNYNSGEPPGAFTFRVTPSSLPVWVVAMLSNQDGVDPTITVAVART